MKITKHQLKQIIKEELEAVLEETEQLEEEEELEEGFKGPTDVGVGYNPDNPEAEESEAAIAHRNYFRSLAADRKKKAPPEDLEQEPPDASPLTGGPQQMRRRNMIRKHLRNR